jgi:cell division protein FtsQ
LLGLAEMKIAIRRGKASTATDADVSAGSGYGVGSAVLDAPEESFAPQTDRWPIPEPAPAGALQRGFGSDAPIETHNDEFGEGAALGRAAAREAGFDAVAPYVPRRGSAYGRLRGLWRSVGGKIALGIVAAVVLGAVAVAVAAVRFYLLHDERFLLGSSAQIQISGDEHLTRAQVLSVFAGDLERNIFWVSLAERRADLERLPWVEHATVMRLLPNHIRVAITERKPVAFVRQGTQIGLVDAGGVLLDMPPETAGDPAYSFPVLTGISADDPVSVRAARMEVYRRFMQELDGSGERLSSQVSEVDVSNPEDVKALVASGGTDILVHFGDEQFVSRFKQFKEHLPEWRQQYPKLASADMRYEGQIVLEMQQGAGVPVNDAATDAGATTEATTNAMDAKVSATDAKLKTNAVDAVGRGGKAKGKPVKKAVVVKGAKTAAAGSGVTP